MFFLFVLYLFVSEISCSYAQFNMREYKQMPPLYQLDDYDQCLRYTNNGRKGTYCVVYAEIVPNTTSELWRQIATFSADHRHFRHDHLFRGVCLQRCEHLQGIHIAAEIQDGEITSYHADVHKRRSDEREKYDDLLRRCLNYDFQLEYNLTLATSIEYCETNDSPLQYDSYDITVYAVFSIIGILNIFSSWWDYHLKKTLQSANNQNNNFYRTELNTSRQKILTSFSICRNYYRLLQPPIGQIAEDLKFFNAFRVAGLFLVIYAHVALLFMAVPVGNPEFIEKLFYSVESDITENGSVAIQIFFVMSGFLLCVSFADNKIITPHTSVPTCVALYFKTFIYRYLRLVPTLIIVILFNGSILVRLQDGPFWRHFTEADRVFCREYWWKNIFFINNYLLRESCSLHTWYLAADMQLYEMFLIILILILKYPQLKRLTYSILLVLTLGIHVSITYWLELDAIFHSKPETFRYMYFKDAETLYQAYAPFYTNIGGYLFGFLCAEKYVESRRSASIPIYKGVLKYELAWWLWFPAALGLLFTGALFMSYDFDKPSIWVALFAAFYKNLWIVSICCVVLLGIAYEMACLPVFRPMARISYQAYLWHLVILRLLAGFSRQPIFLNRFYLVCTVFLAFALTNFIAFFFAMIVEYPIAEILNSQFKTTTDKSENKNSIKKKSSNEIGTSIL